MWLILTSQATSYCFTTAKHEDVTTEMEWPGTDEHRSKVLSLVAYRCENANTPDFRRGVESVFGFEAKAHLQRHAFAKAAMDKAAPPSRFDDPILESTAGKMLMRQPEGVSSKQVFIDIYRHLDEIQTRRFVKEHGQRALQSTECKIVLTHPVACTLEGKENMLNAAKAAGIGQQKGEEICMISEAKAAGIVIEAVWQRRVEASVQGMFVYYSKPFRFLTSP
jgi:hypothetical protein